MIVFCIIVFVCDILCDFVQIEMSVVTLIVKNQLGHFVLVINNIIK